MSATIYVGPEYATLSATANRSVILSNRFAYEEDVADGMDRGHTVSLSGVSYQWWRR